MIGELVISLSFEGKAIHLGFTGTDPKQLLELSINGTIFAWLISPDNLKMYSCLQSFGKKYIKLK
jgi:hypothetical protein